MSNIIGNAFDPYVKKQIEVRQEKLGQYSNISDADLKAFSSKTPYIKLASSVNVGDGKVLEDLKSTGIFSEFEIKDDNLAKNFLLYGGVLNLGTETGTPSGAPFYSGVNEGGRNFGGAYGFLNKSERGYVPLPGITSANVKFLNNGALAIATVDIKAFNRAQFYAIDVLFQRPGYTCLLEFGHSVYFDNDGGINFNDNLDTEPKRILFSEKPSKQLNHYLLHQAIASERKSRDGNYEGFFGKITKFKWQFNKDGSYDITVKLTGMGDVISSLKTNVLSLDTRISGSTEDDSDEIPLVADAAKSNLNANFYNIYKGAGGIKKRGFFTRLIEVLTLSGPDYKKETVVKTFNLDIKEFKVPVTGSNTPNIPIRFKNLTKNQNKDIYRVLKMDGVNENYQESQFIPQVYICFGSLLQLIQKEANINDKKGNPFISFDFNFEDLTKDKNIIHRYPGNTSGDPKNVIVPFGDIPNFLKTELNTTGSFLPVDNIINTGLKNGNNPYFIEGKPYQARLAYVYLSLDYLSRTLRDQVDEDGNLSVIDYLKVILKKINQSLGDLNEFRLISDTETSQIKIISNRNTDYILDENKKDFTVINDFGVGEGQGNFLREITLNSELTDNFATQISIGAQNNSNQSQSDSTSFSFYNNGLVDRVIPEKVSSNETKDTKDEEKIKKVLNEDTLKTLSLIYPKTNLREEYRKNKKVQFNQKTLDAASAVNNQLSSLITGASIQRGFRQPLFFLPFNLSITVDGISGIRLFEGFKLKGNSLPLTYQSDRIQLIVTEYEHDITPQAWTTKISTQAKPIAEISTGSFAETQENFGSPVPLTKIKKDKSTCGNAWGTTPLHSPDILKAHPLGYKNPGSLEKTYAPRPSGSPVKFAGKDINPRNFPRLFKDGSGTPVPQQLYGVLRAVIENLDILNTQVFLDPNIDLQSLTINSGYRSPIYNCRVGGEDGSLHKVAAAVDIGVPKGQERALYNLLLKLRGNGGITKGGLSLYNTGKFKNTPFVHYDIRGVNIGPW